MYRHVLLLPPSKAIRFWCYCWFVISEMNCMDHKFWHVLQLRNNDCCWLSSFLRITALQRTTNRVHIHLTLLIVMLMLVTPTTLMNNLFLFTMASFDLTRAPQSPAARLWQAPSQFESNSIDIRAWKEIFFSIFVTCQLIWRTFERMYDIVNVKRIVIL